MRDQRLLVVDTETGGTDPSIHSILELAAVVWSPSQSVQETFAVKISEPTLCVTTGAMRVNRIDLAQHEGLPPLEACIKLLAWFDEVGMHENRIMLAGHNVQFDEGFIQRLFRMACSQWEYSKVFHHRLVDIASIARGRVLAGTAPEGVTLRANMDEIYQAYGIEIPEEDRHTALGDAIGSARALSMLCAS